MVVPFDAWSVNVTGLSDAVHGFRATVTDKANNTSPYSDSTIVTVDSSAPTVVSTIPQSDATGESPATNVSAIFSEPLDPAQFSNTNGTFTLRENSTSNIVPATVTLSTDGKTLLLNPNSALGGTTKYTATILGGPSGIKDKSGNTLASDYSWSFTTMSGSVAPTVNSTDPSNGASDVSVTPCICAKFSTQMNATTINTNTVLVKYTTGNSIAGQVSYNPATKIASFNPTSALNSESQISATIKSGPSGVASSTGTRLAANYTWTFTTMFAIDNHNHSFIAKWGTQGDGNGQFQQPYGMAFDKDAGVILVTEPGSSFGRIQEFNEDGTLRQDYRLSGSRRCNWNSDRS